MLLIKDFKPNSHAGGYPGRPVVFAINQPLMFFKYPGSKKNETVFAEI